MIMILGIIVVTKERLAVLFLQNLVARRQDQNKLQVQSN